MSLFVEDEDIPEGTNDVLVRMDMVPDPAQIPVVFEEPLVIPVFPEREVNCALPLKYQQEIVEDMLTRDGLLVLGRGLGWEMIAANLLNALSAPTVTLRNRSNASEETTKRSLLFILNGRDDEIVRIGEELADLQWIDNNTDQPLVAISGESHTTAAKRKETYLKGGVISITSRVLVVDLLSGVIDANDITGLLVLHAERLKETSNDAFIINIFRDNNDWGFIKAISDEPEAITGFTPLASKLKLLRLSNVFLWPRFHVEVSSSLNFRGKKLLTRQKQELESRRFVTEINVKLTYKMTKIQLAILSCIKACLGELKRHNAELATEYWDIANSHDPDFVRRIRMSLDPHWHRLTYTSKQLVYDLGTLTDLLKQLVTADAVTFYQIVQRIVDLNVKHALTSSNATSMSPWLNLDESNTIIAYARDRAIGKVRVHTNIVDVEENQETAGDIVKEEYLLEELPKWDQLGILLDDILHEKSVSQAKDQGPILIMCSSSAIVEQISTLVDSMKEHVNNMTGKKKFTFKKYMVGQLNGYLKWKEISSLIKKINSEMLIEQPKEETKEDEEQLHITKTFTRNGQPVSKRRRTRGDSASARVSRLYSGSATGKNVEPGELDPEIMKKLNEEAQEEQNDNVIEVDDPESDIEEGDGGFFVADDDIKFEHIDKDDQIIIQTYNETTNDSLLLELSPSYIIMYEPNLSFIRRVEIYQAINKDKPAKTYFMYYGTSVEEEKHLLRIKKEKEAFTRLIREKASLSKTFETTQDSYRQLANRNTVLNTRIAGGANFRTPDDELRVVVDVREFGSSLPNYLYRAGIKVVPCMITVGDYIVSPKICIERKSIPDLIGSFKSGRLYQQCELMFRHYELPTLLIEFDESKSFSLDPFSETRPLKTNPTNPATQLALQQNIQSKIMLLLISFPKLKIIWSSSPFETAQIFLSLKANQEEPDIGSALDKGVNKSVVTEDGGPPLFNDDPIDFIQNIPGINAMNYYVVIQRVRSIEELVKLTKQQFMDMLGDENGRKAYNFLNHQVM